MEILIVVNNLSGGGAEKVAVDLANYFSKQHSVTVLTLSDKKDRFQLKSNIKRVSIDLNKQSKGILGAIIANVSRIFRLRFSILKLKPDVVITFMNRTNIRVLMSLVFSSIPIIITEHNYPKMNPIGFSWEILRNLYYRKAFKLVSVSQGISDCFNYLPENKKTVIYNPTELHFSKSESKVLDKSKKNILSMGRLVKVKNFNLLISAFSEISLDFPNWNLSILGDGPLYDLLNNKIQELKLEERVFLLGYNDAPHTILKESDLFVLSSKSEGLGNVIIEAMKCGVPVISTDCPVGPKELIINNVTGLLVENDSIGSLKDGLIKMLSSEELRKDFVKNAENNLDMFSNTEIFSKWESLLHSKDLMHY